MTNHEDSITQQTDQRSLVLPSTDTKSAALDNQQIVITKDETCMLLESVFNRIYDTSMADVPICNPSLKVEAIAYGRVETEWLGVLITPWCMNFMLLPTETTEGWDNPQTGLKYNHIFPAGQFEFISGKDDELGVYRMCSLFSPMFQFGDHQSALQTAALSLQTLMDPDKGDDISEQEKEMNMIWRGDYPEQHQELEEQSLEESEGDETADETVEKVELSRRDFLRGGPKTTLDTQGFSQSDTQPNSQPNFGQNS